jgi:hypothetical protein
LESDGESRPRRFRIVDKHGLSRFAYNLQIDIDLEGRALSLGLGEGDLPGRGTAKSSGTNATQAVVTAPSAEELFDDLAGLLQKNTAKTMTED